MARRRGPARWPLVVVAALFVGLGVLLLVDDDGGSGRPLEGESPVTTTATIVGEPIDGDAEPIELERTDYAITYRVEGFTDGGAVVDIERRWVRPPYASRVETVPADDEDAAPTFLQIADFGILQTGREDEEPVVLRTEPSVAPGDVRVDVDGLEWRHEARTVLDLRCQVFRSAGPVDVARQPAVDAGEDTWADLCVGDDGLLLQEEWVIDGEPFRRRTAIELDASPALDDGLFEPGGQPTDGPEGGALGELTADSVPPGVAFYALAEPPPGFRHRGRFGYSPPRAAIEVGQAEPSKVALILDVYEDGDGGLLVVANGGTSDNTDVVAVDPSDDTVSLGPIGPGEVHRDLRQNEVRAAFDRGRFLRVWGTLPVPDLVDVARTLTATTDPDGEVTPKP